MTYVCSSRENQHLFSLGVERGHIFFFLQLLIDEQPKHHLPYKGEINCQTKDLFKLQYASLRVSLSGRKHIEKHK